MIDQIGLANPLAAHTARLEDGRIGHDKNLFPDWAVAEGPLLKERPYIPPYLDEDWIAEAEVALKCPETDAHAGRRSAVRWASAASCRTCCTRCEFTRYRIDRVPQYELLRCGLR